MNNNSSSITPPVAVTAPSPAPNIINKNINKDQYHTNHPNNQCDIDELETCYQFEALSNITPRLQQYIEQIEIIRSYVFAFLITAPKNFYYVFFYRVCEEVTKVDVNLAKAREVISAHQDHDLQVISELIEDNDHRIINILALQRAQVSDAHAAEARRFEEKIAAKRAAKEARKQAAEEDAKRVQTEKIAITAAAARQFEQQKKIEKEIDSKLVAMPPVPTKKVAAVSNNNAFVEYQQRQTRLQEARAAATIFAKHPAAIQVKKTINLQINSLSATQEQIKCKVMNMMYPSISLFIMYLKSKCVIDGSNT